MFGLPDYVRYIEEFVILRFVILRFYSIHFTVTLARTIRYIEDFVKSRFVKSRLHCITSFFLNQPTTKIYWKAKNWHTLDDSTHGILKSVEIIIHRVIVHTILTKVPVHLGIENETLPEHKYMYVNYLPLIFPFAVHSISWSSYIVIINFTRCWKGESCYRRRFGSR